MGKVCAVKACLSGSVKDQSDRQMKRQPQVSLFKAPKCPIKRQMWNSILGTSLTASQFVCDLHFSKKNIQHEDVFTLTNGKVEIIPHIRWRLHFNAMPIVNREVIEERVMEVVNKKNLPPMEKDHNTEPETTASLQPILPVEEYIGNRLSTSQDNQNPRNNSASVEEQNSEPLDLSLNSIVAHLKEELLPEGWSWMQKENKIVFTLHDRGTFEPRIHIEMTTDLVTIVTITGQRLPLDRATTLMAVQMNFQVVEKLRICSGTGMPVEKHASNCLGVLNEQETYKFERSVERCTRCCALRGKLKRRAKKMEPIATRNHSNSSRKLALVRRNCQRLKTKRWFGMARGACGGNDHPNPETFLQIFRLLCSYFLIKPPRGGNVDGVELLQTLMESKESVAATEQPRRQ